MNDYVVYSVDYDQVLCGNGDWMPATPAGVRGAARYSEQQAANVAAEHASERGDVVAVQASRMASAAYSLDWMPAGR